MKIPSREKVTAGAPGNPSKRTRAVEKLILFFDHLIPPELLAAPETARQARLIANFSMIGSIFGLLYIIFYVLIGHVWGAVIITICSSCYAIAPTIMRWRCEARVAGEFLLFILTSGFTSLCFVEGGLQGHAVAWLVSVPLCAFLILGEKAAFRWATVAFICTAVIAGMHLSGVDFAVTYDPKWNALVSTAGYLGLIVFLFILGLIFERKRAQAFARAQRIMEELEDSNQRLIHLNEEKNDFLGIAAHDLKNPLTAILGSVQMARMTMDQKQSARLLQNISDAANRMHGLIVNLLDINAIEQKGLQFKLEACDIRVLIENTIENNQLAANKKMIEIHFGASQRFLARGDRSAVLQILDNLVSNALKYSLPRSNVHIHTMREGDQVLVAVRDEGPGISESDQKRLFQKFTKLSARPTGGEGSSGLGLAIVKRLAEGMCGTIRCTSQPGDGATFTLSLPLAEEMSLATKPLIPPMSDASRQNPFVQKIDVKFND